MAEKTLCDQGCGEVKVKKDGTLWAHKDAGSGLPCDGKPAVILHPTKECSETGCTCEGDGGPVHELAIIGAFGEAGADVIGLCGSCREPISESDRIRQDGMGGYECGPCGDSPCTVVALAPADHQPGQPPAAAEVSYWQQQAREAATRHFAPDDHSQADPTPAQESAVPFETPGAELDLFETPATAPRELNVSGQPPAERDSYGRYLVKDPDTGDYRRFKNKKPKGITRTTTFVKAASNNAALSDWKCRNVLIGASLRPDIVRKAHGLTHTDNKPELMALCTKLEEAAGAKVSADEGTFLHEFTELMDAGLKTWEDAPKAYQKSLRLYAETLAARGLEPVSGLIERTVFIREFGGVCGTLDRVFYHRPSGQYFVGDVKTGKTLTYGKNEIDAQIWTYAHGINQNGVWDWNTKMWWPAFDGCECVEHVSNEDCRGPRYITVSETSGIIVHMPVQGPDQGMVLIRHADLVNGAAHAQLCADVRAQAKPDIRDWVPPQPALPPVEKEPFRLDFSKIDPTPWSVLFSQVRNAPEARALWDRAAAAESVSAEELARYVEIGREALRGRG